MRLGCACLIGLILLLSPGCGGVVNHNVAGRISSALPHVLGPAKRYDVQVSGTSLGLGSGHIGKVTIHGEDVAFTPQLTVDTLDAEIKDIDLDTRSQKVTGMGPIRFIAGVSAAHLNDYLAATAQSAPSRPQDLEIQLSGHEITLSFTVRPFLVNVPVSITGTIAPRTGYPSQLDFVPTGGQVSVVPVPAQVIDLALSHANPVVDLSTLAIPMTIDRAWVENGSLYLAGTATVPASVLSPSS